MTIFPVNVIIIITIIIIPILIPIIITVTYNYYIPNISATYL